MTQQRKIFTISFLLVSFLSLYFLTTLSTFTLNTSRFSRLITIDVLLTIPFVYFLLVRKTSIPKLTVIPILFLGVLFASFIIPSEHQGLLSIFKLWILPVIEICVVSFIIFKVIKTIKRFNELQDEASDFYSVLKSTCYEILPKGIVIPLVTEISVFYYGFIYWKKRILKDNEYTYHKESGGLTLIIAFIFIIAVETIALHQLLVKWNTTIAWIITFLSIYTGIQLFGFTKSILKRPIYIANSKVFLRYGIMKESEIAIENISNIEFSSKDFNDNDDVVNLSLLGALESHNTIIHLSEYETLTSLYGSIKKYKSIALSLDEKGKFKTEIEAIKCSLPIT